MDSVIDDYVTKAKAYLNAPEAEVKEYPFGLAVIKGNFIPSSKTSSITIQGLELVLNNAVFHERVAILNNNVQIRSHQEEYEEIVINIGDAPIWQTLSTDELLLLPGQAIYSYSNDDNFNHGFRVEKPGLLYVAKSLRPEFVNGNMFIVPENTYEA